MLIDAFHQQGSSVSQSLGSKLWRYLLILLIAAQSVFALAAPHSILEPAYQHFAQQSAQSRAVDTQVSHFPTVFHTDFLHEHESDQGCEHFYGVQLLHISLLSFNFHVLTPVIEALVFGIEMVSVVPALLLRPPIV